GRRRHTRFSRDWSSDVCSSDLGVGSASTSGSGADTSVGSGSKMGSGSDTGCSAGAGSWATSSTSAGLAGSTSTSSAGLAGSVLSIWSVAMTAVSSTSSAEARDRGVATSATAAMPLRYTLLKRFMMLLPCQQAGNRGRVNGRCTDASSYQFVKTPT